MINFLRRRTLCRLCVCFACSGALTFLLSYKLSPVFGGIAVAGFALLLILSLVLLVVGAVKRKPNKGRAVMCALAAFLASLIMFSYFGIKLPNVYSLCGDGISVRAVVASVKRETVYGASYEVRVESVNGVPVSFGAELETEYEAGLESGERITAVVSASLPQSELGSFDYRGYALSRGILLTLTSGMPSELSYEGRAEEGPRELFRRLRTELDKRIRRLYSDETEGVLSALILGDSASTPVGVRHTFERCGLSHLLAVSGVHLTVLLGSLDFALTKLKFRGKSKLAVLIFAALFYMSLTGFSASVTRASLMYIFFRLCSFGGRRGDPATALSFALAVIIAFSPVSICDVSLLLSFSATFGIITLGMKLDGAVKKRIPLGEHRIWAKIMRSVASSVVVSASAMLCSLPVIWVYFGEFSLLFPLTNLLLTYPVTFLIILVPASLILSAIPFLSSLPPLISICADVLCRGVLHTVEFFANAPNVMASLRYPFVGFIGVAAVVAIAVLVLLRRDSTGRIATVAAAACLLYGISAASYSLMSRASDGLIYRYEGSNDILTFYSNGLTLACDISNGSKSTGYAIMDTLNNALYVSELDVYMITHYHARTVNQIAKLLERETVRELLLPSPYGTDEEEYFRRISENAMAAGCIVTTYDHTRVSNIVFGDLTLETAELEYAHSSTHPLSAINAVCRGKNALYIGSSASGLDFCEKNIEGADAVIFGIHGPKTKLIEGYPSSAKIFAPDMEPFYAIAALYPKGETVYLSDGDSVRVGFN